MSNFPQLDPLRFTLARVTAILLLLIAVLYWYGMRPDMGAVSVFAIPALVMSVLVFLRWRVANLLAGMFALLWFSHGVMIAFVDAQHRWWALGIVLLSVLVVFCVSWVGLKVRKLKRTV